MSKRQAVLKNRVAPAIEAAVVGSFQGANGGVSA
jgi:hypothetical protein